MGLRGLVEWTCRDRRTGRITIAQPPNAPLLVGLGAAVVGRVVRQAGMEEVVLTGLATAALTWWGLDELFRGVNPFRRVLGAAALVGVGVGVLRR